MDSSSSITPARPSRKALAFIVITVILNTLGLTLMAPVAPFLVSRYVSDPTQLGVMVGWLTTIYAICQFIAAPGLGALSDRFGRRPLLLICLLGSALGYLLLGVGGALWVLFLGRAIDGLTGANTTIMIAYIADIVPENDRSKYFGWIGAIGAASIVLGPAAGGLMARFGYQMPFFVAGAVSLINVIFGLLFMPESLSQERRSHSIRIADLNPLVTLKQVFALPQLRWVLAASFLYTLGSIIIPSNICLFTKALLNWDADSTGILFSVFGVATIVVQAALLQWMLKKMRASQITMTGLAFTVAAFVVIGCVAAFTSPMLVYAGIILFALGDGLTSPALLELITQAGGTQSQGQVQGANQSLLSLANIIGPLIAGSLYDRVGPAAPYFSGAGIVILTIGALSLALISSGRAKPLSNPTN